MANKLLTVLKDFRYRTRMMRAGDPVEMDEPQSRFYTAIGAVGSRDADNSGKVILPQVPAPRAPLKAASISAMSTKNTAQTADGGKRKSAKKARAKKARAKKAK